MAQHVIKNRAEFSIYWYISVLEVADYEFDIIIPKSKMVDKIGNRSPPKKLL